MLQNLADNWSPLFYPSPLKYQALVGRIQTRDILNIYYFYWEGMNNTECSLLMDKFETERKKNEKRDEKKKGIVK